MIMLRVLPVHGEPTRYHVESRSLQCTKQPAKHVFKRQKRPELRIGSPCPKCGAPLDTHFYLVDLAGFNFNGQCGCPWFEHRLAVELATIPPAERGAGPKRCSHIEAARNFALDLTLKQHEKKRLEFASGQSEERQP